MTNKEIVIDFFKALDNKDFATAEKLLGPSHQMHSSMSPVPMNAEQHLAMSKAFDDAFTNGKHEWADILEVGNKVVARGIWRGVHTGTFNGIAPTGKNVALTFIAIIEIENNEMKNQWVEMDAMSLMMQLGAVPAPAHA
jgi:predicted ester cyclase